MGKNDEAEDVVRNNVSDDEPPDAAESDYDIPLASLAGASTQETSNKQGWTNNEPAQRVLLEKERYNVSWSFVSWKILWTTFRRYCNSALLFDVY